MLLRTIILTICIFLNLPFLSILAQDQTVGLFNYSEESYEGYTLIAGFSNEVFLIDNCGLKVHKWSLNSQPGMVTYLLEDGRLLRAGRTNSAFNGGGSGGLVQIYNWDSELIWSYRFSNEFEHQHHDLEILPNGNILVLAWDRVLYEEAVQLGRDPELLTEDGIWLEKVVEIKPIGTDEINTVWTWSLRDHVVQDRFPELVTFGNISDNFRKLDLNYSTQQTVDIIHCNSIDYNPHLDQILLSSRSMSEIWIIDHSTTTSEAALSEGGNAGHGGDFLYRWGNPQTYQRGSEMDKVSFGQHDANWIVDGLEGAGNIILYNNGTSRIGPDYSEVIEIALPLDSDGNYEIIGEQAFGPIDFEWVYGDGDEAFFFSSRMSGVQRLGNGNTLVCSADRGQIFELTADNDIVWEYISPVSSGGIISQGNTAAGNTLFRAYRYGIDYPAFENKTLISTTPIEFDPLDYECFSVDTEDTSLLKDVVFNHAVEDFLEIKFSSPSTNTISILNAQGQLLFKTNIQSSEFLKIDMHTYPQGYYYIQFKNDRFIQADKIIKH